MTDKNAMSEAKSLDWITEFKNDPPLHTLFPVTLSNGNQVPGIHIVCASCNNRISGDRIHGRVVQSLVHVLTVAANGYCEGCNRVTHVDFRFRANTNDTIIEWLATNGYWQSRELRQPTIAEKIARGARRLAAWIAAAL